jgi:pilus assembly protein CpaB
MKQKLIPIISIIVGILAFMLTRQYIVGKEAVLKKMIASYEARTRQVKVVAAAKDLPRGTSLQSKDLKLVDIPKANMPERSITPDEAKAMLRRKTIFEIKANQMILWSDVEGGDPGSRGLAPAVQEKLRAISLNISGAAGVSGMVRPNDRVDVLGTFNLPSKVVPGEMETVTLTVLQDVTVLATGQQMAKDIVASRSKRASSGYSTITVEVTPREAELLVFAQQMNGSLALALRNPSDQSYESSLPSINFQKMESSLPELNRFRQQSIRHKKAVRR